MLVISARRATNYEAALIKYSVIFNEYIVYPLTKPKDKRRKPSKLNLTKQY